MKEPHFDEDMYLQEQYGEDDYSEELEQKTDDHIFGYTVGDFIKRLEKLPKDLNVTGYIFQTDDGEIRNTFEMGKIK